MAQKPETVFKNRVREDLKLLPTTWFVKVQQVTICGTPDYLLCVNGSFVALELKKSDKDDPSALQLLNLKKIGKARGVALLVSPENWEATYEFLMNLAHEGEISH